MLRRRASTARGERRRSTAVFAAAERPCAASQVGRPDVLYGPGVLHVPVLGEPDDHAARQRAPAARAGRTARTASRKDSSRRIRASRYDNSRIRRGPRTIRSGSRSTGYGGTAADDYLRRRASGSSARSGVRYNLPESLVSRRRGPRVALVLGARARRPLAGSRRTALAAP